jgi:23S rRNA pseudouridine2605 synthase
MAPDAVGESPDERVFPMRLQRFLARAGVASRRGSENLMTAGRVRVNGRVVTELGSKVDPSVDEVLVDGVPVSLGESAAYLMLNKPSGYVTTMSDPQGRPCVAALVPTDLHPGLFPVGRLDVDTTGLLLFTTNGDAGQSLLHPSRHVNKRYVALVRGSVTPHQLELLRGGIPLDDGISSPARAEVLDPSSPAARPVCPDGVPRGCSVVSLEIHEGRKHQVKRMLRAVNHKVVRLHRESFGPLVLTGVGPGEWRDLTKAERDALERVARGGADADGR